MDLMRILLERDRLSIAIRNSEQDARRAAIELAAIHGTPRVRAVESDRHSANAAGIDSPDTQAAIGARLEMTVARQAQSNRRDPFYGSNNRTQSRIRRDCSATKEPPGTTRC